MSIAQRLVNLSDGLSADGVLSAAKGGTGNTSGVTGTSSPTISAIGYGGDDTATDVAGGKTITLTGTNFASGAKVLINTTPVGVVTVVSPTQITFTAPANAAGSYILYVVNLDGSTAIAVPGIQYSGVPAWSTAAGTLGTGYETSAVSTTVSATSNSAVTYSVVSGTLPTGVTINASGTISGTSPLVGGSTTYTFTVRATDAENQDTDRSFSLTINPDVVTWSSSNTIALPQNVVSTTTLAATSAAGQAISYATDTLPPGLTRSGATVSGTPTAAGTTTTVAIATAAVTDKTAQQTITWTVSIAADTYFPYTTLLLNSETTALPFLADASTNNFAVTAVGDTKPSNFNPYTPGYYSNYFDGSGDVIYATESGGAFTFGTGDYEYSAWIFTTDSGSAQQTIFSRDSTGNAAVPYIYIQPTNRQIGLYYSSFIVGGTTAIAANKWYYITVSRVSGTSRIFVNGVLEGSAADSTNLTAAGKLVVGGQWTGNTNMFVGYISNARVVKGSGVTSVTVPTTPLTAIANTQLLTCQSNRLIDNSANAFAVTKTGDVTVSPFDPFVPNASYATYGSTYFDGTGDYLTTPITAGGPLDFGSGNWTIEAWAFFTGTTTNLTSTERNILSFCNNSGAPYIQFGTRSTSGAVFVEEGTSATVPWSAIGSTALPINTWNHVAATRNGNTISIYLNGVLQASAAYSGTHQTFAKVQIGSLTYNAGVRNDWIGYVSDARIVKGTAVYTTAFTPPSAPLTAIANTQLLTCQTNQPINNQTFLDNSTNAFPITRTGNATQGSFSPYGANWSNYFDGSGDYLLTPTGSVDFLHKCTASWTIEGWFNTGINTAQTIISTAAASVNAGILLELNNAITNNVDFQIFKGGSVYRIYTGTNTTTLNAWNHVAITFNFSTTAFVIYINGVSTAYTTSGTASGFSSATATYQPAIGRFQYTTPGDYFNGYISNLRLVNGSVVYTSNFTPPTAPLTAIASTALLTCQSPYFVDNSLNAFAVTKAGDVSIQKFNPFATVTQTPQSYSTYFNGSTDYTTTVDNSGFLFGTGNFTVECWINTSATTQTYGKRVVSHYTYITGTDYGWNLGVLRTSSSTVQFSALQTGVVGISLTTSNALTPNVWHHIAVTRSGSVASLYLDGVRVATQTGVTWNDTNSITNGIELGSQAGAASTWYDGYISNVRIVKGTAVYDPNQTTLAVPTAPLTAITNTTFLACQDATIRDNSANQFVITAISSPKPRQQNPFGYTTSSTQDYSTTTFGGSAYFDGTGDYLTCTGAISLTGAFTVQGWFYNTSTSGQQQTLFSFNSTNAAYASIRADCDNANTQYKFAVTLSTGATSWNLDLSTNNAYVKNIWNHFAVTRDSANLVKVFINGVQIASGTLAGALYSTSTTHAIGCNTLPGTATNPFIGYISDLQLVNGTALYTANFVPPTAPLTAITNTTFLLNADKAAVQDKSGKFVAETVGDARVSTAIKKYGNSSMYFDGNGDALQLPITPQVYLGTTYTIEAWIYNAGGLNYQAIFELCENNTGGFAALDLIKVGTTISAAVRTATLGTPVSITGGTLVTNTWQHVALSVNAGSARLFLDGTQIGSTTTFPEFPITKTLFAAVGRFANGYTAADTNSWNGYIDDFRITKGYARYTANFTPPSSALLTK